MRWTLSVISDCSNSRPEDDKRHNGRSSDRYDDKRRRRDPGVRHQYAEDGSYPPELTRDKKRAVRKRAALLTVDKREIFFNRGNLRSLWSDQDLQEAFRAL